MSLPETNLRVGRAVFGTTLAQLAASLAVVWAAPPPSMMGFLLAVIQAVAAALLWSQISRALRSERAATRAVAEADLAPLRAALAAARAGDLTARAGGEAGSLADLAAELDAALASVGALAAKFASAGLEVGAAAEAIDRYTRLLAERSGRQSAAIAEVSRKLKALGARSEEVAQIVELLEDVAAETNILALNAAIEASRAGTQGKGFGMVADEVRKLAERSAAATKDIGAFIQGIEATTDDATRTVDEIRGLSDGLVASATQAGAAAAALVNVAGALGQALIGVRVPGQDDTELARALRDRRTDVARALDPLLPLLEAARSPLGEALRQVLGALGEPAVRRPRALTPESSPAASGERPLSTASGAG